MYAINYFVCHWQLGAVAAIDAVDISQDDKVEASLGVSVWPQCNHSYGSCVHDIVVLFVSLQICSWFDLAVLIEVYLLSCHNRSWTVSFGYAILLWERIHPEYGCFYKLYQHAVWYLPEWKSIPDQADPFFSSPDLSFNISNVFIIGCSV